MKKFVKLPTDISKKLNFADIYRYACLFLTPTIKGYTDATFKQIQELTGDTSEETIKNFVGRLRESELVEIQTYYDEDSSKRRNNYYEPEYENFRMISSDIVSLDLSANYKGFLIALFGQCFNNTRSCSLSGKELASKMGVSYSTIMKYLKELTELGYIIKSKKGLTINSEIFKLGENVEREILLAKEVAYSKSEDTYNRVDWGNIKYPLRYIGKMSSNGTNNEIIKC